MLVSAAARDERALRRARAIMQRVLGPVWSRSFAVRYWDGSTDGPLDGGADHLTLVFRDSGAMRRALLRQSELHVGEAFVRGDFDIEGDLERAVALGERIRTHGVSLSSRARVALQLLSLPASPFPQRIAPRLRLAHRLSRPHSRRRDAAAIQSHYDVGNAFYELWLDARMVYSCAYFRSGSEDLDTAQRDKLDLLCRKLRLQPGERLLDIGCGWGG